MNCSHFFAKSWLWKFGNLLILLFIFQLLIYYYYALFVSNRGNKFDSEVKVFSKAEYCFTDIFNNTNLSQDEPTLLSYIRYFHLSPPPPLAKTLDKKGERQEETKKNPDPSEYEKEILRIFKNKRNGFFIEAGANDGLFRSNTLELERRYDWTGLLIEPNPFMLVKLRLQNRNAWIADTCLALSGFPNKIRFMHRVGDQKYMDGMGIIEHNQNNPVPPATKRDPKNYIYAGPVECFPLYSLILALDPTKTTVIDYFSLDVEGIEFRVLKAIPFDKLIIKVISIEYNLVPEGLESLLEFLKSKKYKLILKKHVEIFVAHEDYIDEIDTSHF